MGLHRALLWGSGFFDMVCPLTPKDGADSVEGPAGLIADLDVADDSSAQPPARLPAANALESDLPGFVDALIEEMLPADRVRFRAYLSHMPLGLGVITAGPGFGKTSCLAVGTIGMVETYGKTYATAPSHVAVSNFAERLDRISTSVADRYNKSVEDATSRARYKLVVRGYGLEEEVLAVVKMLQDSSKAPVRDSTWKPPPRFQSNGYKDVAGC